MKKKYSEKPNTDKKRKKRAKKKRAGKAFLTAVSIIVVAVAAFFITVKISAPEVQLTSLLPERAIKFVNEDLLKNTTTTEPATTTTTTATTTQATAYYLPIEDFALNYEKAGNQIGNLLNGGKAATDYSYVYHIKKGEGIIRFSPISEGYYRYYKTADKLSCLNLRGEYLYFVNDDNGKLLKLKKGSSKAETLAENVRFVYVYDNKIYYVTKDNSICLMKTDKEESKTLYSSFDDELTFCGISKDGVYFTVTDYEGKYDFLTVSNEGGRAAEFKRNALPDEMDKLVMENGFLYFYRGTSLYRKKFGSDKELLLAKDIDQSCYPVVDKNRVFYACIDDEKFCLKELNMNSEAEKTMLRVKYDEENPPKFYHGGEYDFIIGKNVYSASSQYTGSENIMKFKDGKWSY